MIINFGLTGIQVAFFRKLCDKLCLHKAGQNHKYPETL
jgi:hypothetical protein